MKVYLATLGCKLNESELEAWSRQFAQDSCELVSDPRQADLCVLNTCTVTHIAASKSRQLARQLARDNPKARLVLTGCFATISPEQANALPNVALVVPNADKDRLVQLAGPLFDDVRFRTTETGCRLPEATSGVLPSAEEEAPAGDNRLWSADGGRVHSASSFPQPRTRAFVKVMDGCNMSCTYCIIPLARGREKSRPLREVVDEVKELVTAGYQEVILTGVQISVYESDHDKAHGLRDLLAAILAETTVRRLRLSSIAPWDLDESLLDLWQDPRLCRHIHLSLQSGCDTVLRRMRRPYSTAQFARVADLARARIRDVAITTDVIVGFPGESDAEFEMGCRFVESMRLARIHVFPYSPRAGTVAAQLPLQVSDATKQARARKMQAIADASAKAFAGGFAGRTMEVLWESQVAGEWSGYTDNYIRVQADCRANLHNRITATIMEEAIEGGMRGRLPEALAG